MFCSFEKKVEHYRVLLKSNRVTVDEEEYFENLVKLVEVSVTITVSHDVRVCIALSKRS